MNLQTLESVLAKDTFTDEDLLAFLSLTDTECCARLWREAYDRTTRVHGNALWFRGLIEISNYCIYDCRYCGIRKGNHQAQCEPVTALWPCRQVSARMKSSSPLSKTSCVAFIA